MTCLNAALAITVDRGLAVLEATVRLSLARRAVAAGDRLAAAANLERAHLLCVDSGFHDGRRQVAELRAVLTAG